MVTAGKVFKLVEPLALEDLGSGLGGYRKEEEHEEDDYRFNLITEIIGLVPSADTLSGVYSHDYITRVFHRGKTVPLPRTVEATFSFSRYGDRVLLTVVEKKIRANSIANRLSETIYERAGNIAEARISPETLRDFHLKNPEDTKITFFDNVDIPNVNKLSLYGSDLVGTTLFEDYCRRGNLWYIVAKSKEFGYVVGVTRDASVTIFNIADRKKYLEYVAKEIYPLIS